MKNIKWKMENDSSQFMNAGLSYKKFKLPPTLVGGCVYQKSAGFSRISVKNKSSDWLQPKLC